MFATNPKLKATRFVVLGVFTLVTTAVVLSQAANLKPLPQLLKNEPILSAKSSKGFQTVESARFESKSSNKDLQGLKLVVFGDSWSDDGTRPDPDSKSFIPVKGEENNYYYNERNTGPHRYGKGENGRWADGPVWPEYLSAFLKTEDYYNFAYGGAKVTNKFVDSPVPDLKTQYEQFLGFDLYSEDYFKTQLAATLKGELEVSDEQLKEEAHAAFLESNRRTLFIFWFGINDMLHYNTLLDDAQIRSDAVDYSVELLKNVTLDISARYPESNILINYSPDVTLFPVWTSRYLQDDVHLQRQRETIKLTRKWNKLLMQNILKKWDTSRAFLQVWDASTWFSHTLGGTSGDKWIHKTNPCFSHETDTLCAKPKTHLFWDAAHLTTEAHRVLASRIYVLDLYNAVRRRNLGKPARELNGLPS
ncbi:uncharacterized protein V1510DRAFT_406666 [Dipodascopsis tothii]|uniref:uncharacterized protein n=1 Tax=Dipodascopsis tothii TaxID=44089 RepID=UPI0034CE00FE